MLHRRLLPWVHGALVGACVCGAVVSVLQLSLRGAVGTASLYVAIRALSTTRWLMPADPALVITS